MALNPARTTDKIILIPEELDSGNNQEFDAVLSAATEAVVIRGPQKLLEQIRVVRVTPLEILINNLLAKFMTIDPEAGVLITDRDYFENEFLSDLIDVIEQT